ncbi:Uncharacterized protein TCM_024240 [Theobroma cacao]|uniref:Uncharacterized protein n=1 Tax=Theobroma cacao TaxID=3641 RepID=A0A061EV24_THECC|nr:Uncharacterized protein TCM_024240 [Theobroma cacao]
MGKLFKIAIKLIKDVFELHSTLDAMTNINDNLVVYDLEQELYVNNVSVLDSVTRLSMMDKILYLIISWSLRLVPSKHSLVTGEDLWFLHHIKAQTPIDLASFIFANMKKIIVGTKTSLIYGQVITRLLQHFNIDISLDDAVSQPKNINLDKATISRIGYCENAKTGTWVHNKAFQKETGNDNDDDEDKPQIALVEQSSSVMPSSSVGNMGTDASLDAMMEKINENTKHLNPLQDTIEDDSTKADHAMTSHLDHIDYYI